MHDAGLLLLLLLQGRHALNRNKTPNCSINSTSSKIPRPIRTVDQLLQNPRDIFPDELKVPLKKQLLQQLADAGIKNTHIQLTDL